MDDTKTAETKPKKMDATFSPPNVGNPPDGQRVEVWTGGECVKGYKKEGRWHAEDGTAIMIDGWRAIEKPKKPAKHQSGASHARPHTFKSKA